MKITKEYLKRVIKEEIEQTTSDGYANALQQQKNKILSEQGAETVLPTQTGKETTFGDEPKTGKETTFGDEQPAGNNDKTKNVVVNLRKQLATIVAEIDKVLGQI